MTFSITQVPQNNVHSVNTLFLNPKDLPGQSMRNVIKIITSSVNYLHQNRIGILSSTIFTGIVNIVTSTMISGAHN